MLTKAKAERLLQRGDVVYYVEDGTVHEVTFRKALNEYLITDQGDLYYDEVGLTWFLHKRTAENCARGLPGRWSQ